MTKYTDNLLASAIHTVADRYDAGLVVLRICKYCGNAHNPEYVCVDKLRQPKVCTQ